MPRSASVRARRRNTGMAAKAAETPAAQALTATDADHSALRARLDDVCRLIGTDREAARIAGVSVTQLHRYVTGASEPRVAPVARLARSAGVRLEWLVWGEEPMRQTGESGALPAVTSPPTPAPANIGLEVVTVKDQAMMPHLWPGQRIYFDPTATYDRPGLYVLGTLDGLAVRDVMRGEGGGAVVRCANATYGPLRMAWEEFTAILKGRVVLMATA